MKKILVLLMLCAVSTASFSQDIIKENISVRLTTLLSEIPNDKRYNDIYFENTEWKLLGFGNFKEMKIYSPIQSERRDCFMIYISETESGAFGACNTIRVRNINIDNNKIKWDIFGVPERTCNNSDEENFIGYLKKVSSYKVTQKGLFLYIDNSDEFLLFKASGL